MTRDLDAMGLLTQVKKGDDARAKNKRQGNQGVPQSQMATSLAPKLNIDLANQQLARSEM